MENDHCANSSIVSQRHLCSSSMVRNDRLFSLTDLEIASRVALMRCELQKWALLMELEDPDAWPSEALLEDRDAWPGEALLEDRDAWPSEALLEDRDAWPSEALLKDCDAWPSEALLEDRDAWPGGAEDALDDKGESRAAEYDWTMFATLRLGGSPDSSKVMIPKACGGLEQSRDDCFSTSPRQECFQVQVSFFVSVQCCG